MLRNSFTPSTGSRARRARGPGKMRFKGFQGSAEHYYDEHENSYGNGRLGRLEEGNGQEQKVIAVLGPTGAGKSTFIKNIVGDETIIIGDNLNSGDRDPASASLRVRH
jgi:translation initiation factor RLI1